MLPKREHLGGRAVSDLERLGRGRCRHFRRMLKNTFRAGVMDKAAFPDKTFHHGGLAPGAESVRNFRGW